MVQKTDSWYNGDNATRRYVRAVTPDEIPYDDDEMCCITEVRDNQRTPQLRSLPSWVSRTCQDLRINDPGYQTLFVMNEIDTRLCIDALVQALVSNTNVKRLYCTGCFVKRPDLIIPLMDGVIGKDACSITELALNGNNLDSSVAKSVGTSLTTNISLRRLMLNDNKTLGDAGVRVIASGLRVNRSLKMLNLASTNVADDGVIALADALRQQQHRSTKCSGLEVLILNTNPQIGVRGCRALADALRDPRCPLKQLHLVGCRLDYECLETLTTAIRDSSMLEVVDLSRNMLQGTGALFAELTRSSSSSSSCLKRLCLAGGHMTDDDATALMDGVVHSHCDAPSCLEALDLSYNNISERCCERVQEQLLECGLKEVDFEGNKPIPVPTTVASCQSHHHENSSSTSTATIFSTSKKDRRRKNSSSSIQPLGPTSQGQNKRRRRI